MTGEQDKGSKAVKWINHGVVSVLCLILFGGGIYMSQRGSRPASAPPAVPAVSAKAAASSALDAFAPIFDAVSADATGRVVAAGKAQAGATILLQNGTQTLGETKADENGEWLLMLEQPLPAGGYAFSLLAEDPKTRARVPGQHRFALTIEPHGKSVSEGGSRQLAAGGSPASGGTAQAAAAVQPEKSLNTASVKHGDTLWGIAQRFYGKGFRYGAILEANKERIKNPNLIYPNQQFNIPK